MRIGIDVNPLSYAKKTGVGRYAECLLRELFKHNETDQYILYAALPIDQTLKTEWEKYSFITYRESRFPSRFFWQQFFQGFLISQDSPDIYLSLDGLLPIHMTSPAVVAVHDILWRHYPKTVPPHVLFFYQMRFMASVQKAKCCIISSHATKNDIINSFDLDRNKIKVIYPGRDIRFSPATASEKSTVLEKLGLKQPFFLYVGNLMPHKNVTSLVQAYAKAKKQVNEKRFPSLVIVGHGSSGQKQSLQSLIEQNNLNQSVKFAGYLSLPELITVYSSAFALVLPSLIEGFGFPILEAQACGTPVICSDRYSLPEVGAKSVLYFNPFDMNDIAEKLMALYSDESLRADLIEKGKANICRFSWEKAAWKIYGLIKNCVGVNDHAKC